MTQPAERHQASQCVEAPINYVVYTGKKPVTHIAVPGGPHTRRDAEFRQHVVPVHDARAERPIFAGT